MNWRTPPPVNSTGKFTWRAGVVYVSDIGLAPYFSYTTSFNPTLGTSASGAAFVPTTGQQYELGVKYQPVGYNSFVTVAAYNLTQQHALTVDSDNPFFQVQTGEIRSRGIEVEAHANLAPGFNVIGSYAYNDAIVTKSNGDDLNHTPTYIPRNLAAVWGRLSDPRRSAPRSRLRLGVRYVGFTFGDTENTLKVPGYTLVDAAINYDLSGIAPRLDGWKLAINAANLFDKQYVSECSGLTNCVYGLRRTVLATFRHTW